LVPLEKAVMRYFIASLLLAICCEVAHADYQVARVDLVCDRIADLALVRFAMSENDSPSQYATLPKKVDGGLSILPGTDRTDCRLSRGWDIRIRAGEGQVFPYGAGGADPPAFFSLWINRRKVLSKFVWKPGYDAAFDGKPSLVDLIIRPESLTFCFQKRDDKAVSCEQQPLALRKHPIDQEEYPEGSKPKTHVGTILIEPTSPDARACQHYLDAIKIEAPDSSVSLPHESRLSGSMALQPGQKLYNPLRTLTGAFANVQDRRVAALTGGSHYFDGDIFVIAPHDASPDDVDAFFPRDEDLEQAIAKPPPDGWTIISGGQPALYPKVSPRYVHLLPEEIDGELFFLAYPTNHDVRPSAILVKPLKAGFVSLCTFQRVEPHY
jgi:hypothetical protein